MVHLKSMKLLVLLSLFSLISTAKIPVWIDYDVAMGKVIRDVDDGLALIVALRSKELDIKGISIGFGNIKDLNHMYKITKKTLRKVNRLDIPVYYGAWNKSHLQTPTAATHAIAKELAKGKLSVIAMGRMTNIASVYLNYPQVTSNIEQIIINAGRRLETETQVGRFNVIMPDTNIDDHLEATRVLVEKHAPIVMIPTQLMSDKFITNKHMRAIRRNWRSTGRWFTRNARVWKFIWRLYPMTKGFIPWDVFLVSYLTHREDFFCDENIPIGLKNLKNNASSIFRKKYRKDFKDFLVASYDLDSPLTGSYCYDVKKDHLLKVIRN